MHIFSESSGDQATGREGIYIYNIYQYQIHTIIMAPKNAGGTGIAHWGIIRFASERGEYVF
jgi:hypothetical protein